EHAVMETRSATVGAKLDPETKHVRIEASIDAMPKSRFAEDLNQLAAFRTQFSSLINSDVPAGLAVSVPFEGIIDRVLGTKSSTPGSGARVQLGLQLAGTGVGDLTLITALQGPEINV